jgi:hypothetical protein
MNTHTYVIDNDIKIKVLQLVGWTEQQYAQFIYDCGLLYLQCVIDEESDLITSFIRRSTIYWNWWKLHWEMRDAEFIEGCEQWAGVIEDHEAVYLNKHHPRTLAAALYLNGKVLEESYCSMVQDLNKAVLRQKEAV